MSAVDDLISGKKPTRKTGSAVDALIHGGTGQPILGGLASDSGTTVNTPEPVAKGVSKVIDLMSRPGETAMHVYSQPDARHPDLLGALGVFAHGEAPEQYTADTENALRQIVPYDKLPGWARTGARLGMQTIGDPTTAIGGSGLSRHLTEAAIENAVPLAMRGAQAVARRAPATEPLINLAGHVHDFVTPGGQPFAHTLRELALQKGRAGVQDWQRLYSLHNAGEIQGDAIATTLKQRFGRAIHGLSSDQEMSVYHAIHNGTVNELPADLQERAAQIKQLTDSLAYLRGSKKVRDTLTARGFTLPDELAKYDTVGARGLQKFTQYRENYVPMPHDLTPEQGARMAQKLDTVRKGYSITRKDPHLLARPNTPELEDDPTLYREAFEGAFGSGARHIAGYDTQQRVAELFAPRVQVGRRLLTPSDIARGRKTVTQDALPWSVRRVAPSVAKTVGRTTQRYKDVPKDIRNMFEPREQQLSPFMQTMAGVSKPFRQGSNLGKSTLFDIPVPHMRNIAWLTALHSPEALPGALLNFAKTKAGFATGADRDAVMGEAMRAGAAHAPNVEQSGLVNLLNKFGPAGKAAAKVYDASGKVLWGFDDAAKTAVWNRYLKRYKDPLIAAYHAQRDLVDYSRTSPLSETVRTLMPFATWRTQLPASVVRGIAKNPQNALFLDRATGGMAFGGQRTDSGGTTKYQTPLMEGLQPLEEPKKFLRGSLGPSGKLIASGLANVLNPSTRRESDYNRNWWTYGEHPLPRKKNGKIDWGFLINQTPFVGQGLQYAGQGMFSESPRDQILYQLLGREHYGP